MSQLIHNKGIMRNHGTSPSADRIVLNAYFRMGYTAGGFRVWWRTLTGSEETLDNAHFMRLADVQKIGNTQKRALWHQNFQI